MKILLILKSIFILSFILLSCTSCNKTKCNDQHSQNYLKDEDCEYIYHVNYWWKKSFIDSCNQYGIASFKIYLENEFVGEVRVGSKYWDTPPECDNWSAYTWLYRYRSDKKYSFIHQHVFVDSAGTIWNTPVTIEINQSNGQSWCNAFELKW